MSPQVGEEFGEFRIDGVLGRGGMGVVFRAWQGRMQRNVALKVLPPEYAADPAYRARFGREAAALARVDSPHIVTIFDHGEVDGSLYLAMQLVDGPDLSAALASGPLPPARALSVVDQVASALGDAHEIGVVHRDVKASNVLLRRPAAHDDEDFAYLCDFGIARSVDAGPTADTGGSTGGVIGTIGYMAPERLDGAPATAASDVYALGCLLWTLLTGSLPFRGTQPEVIMKHMTAPAPQLVVDDQRTAAVNELLAAMMAKDPAARPSVREVRERIRAIRADAPVRAAVHVRSPPRAGRTGSRRWLAVTGAVAVAVVVAGAVAAFVLQQGEPAAERIARSTPAGLICRPVAPPDAEVQAEVLCSPGPEVGELRIAALADANAAAEYLGTAAGVDPGGLAEGRCPDDLPTRQTWERDRYQGTLVCTVVGTTTRYAWTNEEQATVSVLDGQAGTPYPRDLRAVDDFFAAVRFGA